jgi:hypothetical protein
MLAELRRILAAAFQVARAYVVADFAHVEPLLLLMTYKDCNAR